MTTTAAQLIIPRLTWDSARGFDASRQTLERGLALGVGGFMLGPAPQEDVRALTKEMRSRAKHPLLVAADVERGAGQVFTGATGLPPLAAIAALNEPETLRKAARLTGREVRNIGVNWALAPVLDLDLVADNPIVGSRSLGANAGTVSRLGEAWIEACQQEGVLACAKHFPGHGRTTTDSHLERSTVRASRHELMAHDIQPFRAAIKANVASVMTAHVFYPALDPGGAMATLSMAIVRVLLRERLGFEGLVVTDALDKRGATTAPSEGQSAVGALFAGCDLVLAPTDLDDVAHAIEEAVVDGTLDEELLVRSQRRRLKWAQWASPPNEWRKASTYDIAAAADLAERVVRMVRGGPVAGARNLRRRRELSLPWRTVARVAAHGPPRRRHGVGRGRRIERKDATADRRLRGRPWRQGARWLLERDHRRRQPDGRGRAFGRPPPSGSPVWTSAYRGRTGGRQRCHGVVRRPRHARSRCPMAGPRRGIYRGNHD